MRASVEESNDVTMQETLSKLENKFKEDTFEGVELIAAKKPVVIKATTASGGKGKYRPPKKVYGNQQSGSGQG